MTRNYWLYLWLALFALQALTLWMHRKWIFQKDLPVVHAEPALLQLAERTNEVMQLQILKNPIIEDSSPVRRSESLVMRESLILELHRLQEQLSDMGVDTQIVEDLEAFLGTMDASESISRLNAFIAGILDWIRPHANGEGDCSLERLNLFPGKAAHLPVLAFELAGSPGQMAKSLLTSTDDNSRWDLIEIDLLLPENDMECWLRGSFAFVEH